MCVQKTMSGRKDLTILGPIFDIYKNGHITEKPRVKDKLNWDNDYTIKLPRIASPPIVAEIPTPLTQSSTNPRPARRFKKLVLRKPKETSILKDEAEIQLSLQPQPSDEEQIAAEVSYTDRSAEDTSRSTRQKPRKVLKKKTSSRKSKSKKSVQEKQAEDELSERARTMTIDKVWDQSAARKRKAKRMVSADLRSMRAKAPALNHTEDNSALVGFGSEHVTRGLIVMQAHVLNMIEIKSENPLGLQTQLFLDEKADGTERYKPLLVSEMARGQNPCYSSNLQIPFSNKVKRRLRMEIWSMVDEQREAMLGSCEVDLTKLVRRAYDLKGSFAIWQKQEKELSKMRQEPGYDEDADPQIIIDDEFVEVDKTTGIPCFRFPLEAREKELRQLLKEEGSELLLDCTLKSLASLPTISDAPKYTHHPTRNHRGSTINLLKDGVRRSLIINRVANAAGWQQGSAHAPVP